jgi:hypothetical protein
VERVERTQKVVRSVMTWRELLKTVPCFERLCRLAGRNKLCHGRWRDGQPVFFRLLKNLDEEVQWFGLNAIWEDKKEPVLLIEHKKKWTKKFKRRYVWEHGDLPKLEVEHGLRLWDYLFRKVDGKG